MQVHFQFVGDNVCGRQEVQDRVNNDIYSNQVVLVNERGYGRGSGEVDGILRKRKNVR